MNLAAWRGPWPTAWGALGAGLGLTAVAATLSTPPLVRAVGGPVAPLLDGPSLAVGGLAGGAGAWTLVRLLGRRPGVLGVVGLSGLGVAAMAFAAAGRLLGGAVVAWAGMILVATVGVGGPDLGWWGARLPWRDRPARWIGIGSFALFGLGAAGGLHQIFPPTGDEPHYLVAAHSLVEAGDIFVEDDYERGVYRRFYDGPLDAHQVRAPGGRHRLPLHGVGLSALIAPALALGEAIEGDQPRRQLLLLPPRLVFALAAALLAANVFLLGRAVTGRSSGGWAALGVLFSTVQIWTYSRLIYPDLLAGVVTVYALRQVVERPRRPVTYLGAALLVGCLPWLGIKFLALGGALGLVLLGAALRGGGAEGERGRALRAAAVLLAGLTPVVALFVFLSLVYGSLSPFVLYRGAPVGAAAQASALEVLWANLTFKLGARLHFAVRSAAGLFLDQRDGLFLLAPILALAPAGWWARRSRPGLGWLVLPVLAHVAIYCYETAWSGHAPPGRPLVPLLGVFAVLAAAAWTGARPAGWLRWVGTVALGLSAGVAATLPARQVWAYDPIFRRTLELRSRYFTDLGRVLGVPLQDLLPSYVAHATFPMLPNLLWPAALLALTIAAGRHLRESSLDEVAPVLPAPAAARSPWWNLVAVLFAVPACLVVWSRPVAPRVDLPGSGRRLVVAGDLYEPEKAGVWLRGGGWAELCALGSKGSAPPRLRLGSLVAGRVEVWSGSLFGAHRTLPVPAAPVDLTPATSYDLGAGRRCLYLRIHAVDGLRPVDRHPTSQDYRNLGVFLQQTPPTAG